MPGLWCGWSPTQSILGDDRPIPVEFVIHADQGGLCPLSYIDDLADRSGSWIEVLRGIVVEPHVIIFGKHGPIRRKHPFAADTNGHSGLGKARGLDESAARGKYPVPIAQKRHTALDIAEECRRPQVADPAGRGVDSPKTVGLRESRKVRQRMPAVDVAEIELAPNAEYQTAGLEVTTDLSATDKAAVVFTAVVRGSGDSYVLEY